MTFLRKSLLTLISTSLGLFCLSQDAFARHSHSHSSPSQTIVGLYSLQNTIANTINNVSPDLNMGIYIRSMKDESTVYARNASSYFVPASILKVMTAESALLYLGSSYHFSTNFLTDAPNITNGVLNGNLYLVHSGDPSLTYFDLTDLMQNLKAKHIQKIAGNVFIDTTAYDQEMYGPGWISNDKSFCYAAPISASIINHNCLIFQIAPSKRVGRAANIIENSQYFVGGIQNNVVTKPRGTRACSVRLNGPNETGISVSGCLPKGHSTEGVSTVITDIIHYNKSLTQNLFQRYGIQIMGHILPGVANSRLPVIASHQSIPLRDLLSEMLKKSDNIIAGSVFKKMGELYNRQPGSWENASSAVKQILKQKIGVNTWGMNIVDGSGLSRNNQITPFQMMQVLDFAYHDQLTNYDFISALPIAGIDGTLKNRMKNIAWKVRAKTGTMSGVVALAGYAITKDKEPLAFVIIINGRLGMGWRYKEMENSIVTELANFSRS